jgi:hypothetical protein
MHHGDEGLQGENLLEDLTHVVSVHCIPAASFEGEEITDLSPMQAVHRAFLVHGNDRAFRVRESATAPP